VYIQKKVANWALHQFATFLTITLSRFWEVPLQVDPAGMACWHALVIEEPAIRFAVFSGLKCNLRGIGGPQKNIEIFSLNLT
jgi:hypothetical protein